MGNPAPHRARKRFGQHFLHDKIIIDRILNAIAPEPGELLLEIGPGLGALTFPLLGRCDALTVVELDRDLIPMLQAHRSAHGKLEVINSDILKFELAGLSGDDVYRIVGNLPYNISTPLMFHLMDSIHRIKDMHFMVQKEVALRIVANPGTRDYGRLSVMIQHYCKCEYLMDVAPGCFTPPPKVDSAIIRLIPHAKPQFDVGDFKLFASIVKTAFGQRRKTIGKVLKNIIDQSSFDSCQIDRRLRAENLSLQDFACLSKTLVTRSEYE